MAVSPASVAFGRTRETESSKALVPACSEMVLARDVPGGGLVRKVPEIVEAGRRHRNQHNSWRACSSYKQQHSLLASTSSHDIQCRASRFYSCPNPCPTTIYSTALRIHCQEDLSASVWPRSPSPHHSKSAFLNACLEIIENSLQRLLRLLPVFWVDFDRYILDNKQSLRRTVGQTFPCN